MIFLKKETSIKTVSLKTFKSDLRLHVRKYFTTDVNIFFYKVLFLLSQKIQYATTKTYEVLYAD